MTCSGAHRVEKPSRSAWLANAFITPIPATRPNTTAIKPTFMLFAPPDACSEKSRRLKRLYEAGKPSLLGSRDGAGKFPSLFLKLPDLLMVMERTIGWHHSYLREEDNDGLRHLL